MSRAPTSATSEGGGDRPGVSSVGTADKFEMVYDGEGRRTKVITDPATGSAATREFRYQGDAIVEERLDGVVSRSYLIDESGSVVELVIPSGASAGTYLVTWTGHGDALARWRGETSGALTLANSFIYGTWGQPTTATHNGIADLGFRFLYVGEFDVQWDNDFGLGLYYMHARHYSPTVGRFLQPDPDRTEANLYAYAANNPVTEIDPDGTCFIFCQLAIGALIDSVVYLATTDNASLGGLAQAVVGGAVESAINPLAKLGKISKLANAATKVVSKFSKASRITKRGGAWRTPDGRFAKNPHTKAKPPQSSTHGNSYDSDRVTKLYRLNDRKTREMLKYGISSNTSRRYTRGFLSDKTITTIATGSRRNMARLERKLVSEQGARLNKEPWSSHRGR